MRVRVFPALMMMIWLLLDFVSASVELHGAPTRLHPARENSSSLLPPAQAERNAKIQGFLGAYHPFKGTVYGSDGWTEGELIQHAFSFGENAIISQASYNGYTFEENVNYSCREWDVNKVYGILRPPSEQGAVNQPGDADLFKPYATLPGMIQGAHRFSELAKRCPQISGVIMDDFYNDYPSRLSGEKLRDIKDALRGKRVDEKGNVDHSSSATTPHLKLYAVLYNHQLDRVDKTVLGLIDGVSFWVWKQNEAYAQFDDYIATIEKTYPNKDIIAGVYVFNGEVMSSAGVHHIIERAVDLYAQGRISSLLIFSAIWMSREKISRERWEELALPRTLDSVYYPFLGAGTGRVVDAKTGKPVKDALISVTRVTGAKGLLVARKLARDDGEYSFGAWAGHAGGKMIVYEIQAAKPSYNSRSIRVRLRVGETLRLADVRLRLR
jgi:hypothetical protein